MSNYDSFDKDIWTLPLESNLLISIDDVGGRVGALIAHDEHGNKVGVVTNGTDDLGYHEFVVALTRATEKSKWNGLFIEKGMFIPSGPDSDEERHYFTFHILP